MEGEAVWVTAEEKLEEIYAVEQKKKKKQSHSHFICGLIVGMMVSLFLVTGAYLVTRIQTFLSASRANSVEVADEGIVAKEKAITNAVISKMELIETVIDAYFYKEDTDKAAMADGAFKGMVASLGDPYSEYYTAKELEDVMQGIEGIYYGIGAYVSMDTTIGVTKISGIIAGAPAEEADIRENDIIYAVNGEETYGWTLNEVVSKIKGPEGTKAVITFIRDGNSIDIEVERRKVENPTVKAEMYDNGIAYIQIKEFDEITVDQFTDALAVAKGSDMQGLILDLRSNPGGSLSAVVEIARSILPKGLIVYTEDRNGKRKEYACDGTKELQVPMVVLINGNSASASEILAGAIKDYKTGTLLGTTTFGKGIVQQPISLGDGSAVKLTISSYFTPNGINIHGTGIEPDEVCEFDGERYYSEEEYDNQLERAKELLQEKISE